MSKEQKNKKEEPKKATKKEPKYRIIELPNGTKVRRKID